MYKDLLLQIMPEVELLEPKERADRGKKTHDNNGTSQGQPSVSIGQDRLGQDRLGQDSTGQDSKEKENLKEIKELLKVTEEEATVIINTCKKYKANEDVAVVVKEKLKIISARGWNNPFGALIKAIKEDWKQSSIKTNNNNSKLRFNDFKQRDTDYEELEKKLLGWDED